VFAETLAIEFGQTMAMAIFFHSHFVEEISSGREVGAQRVGEIAVDVAVFFFSPDGEGQDLGFVEVAEFHEHGNGMKKESIASF